jgi:hypothetical protein
MSRVRCDAHMGSINVGIKSSKNFWSLEFVNCKLC